MLQDTISPASALVLNMHDLFDDAVNYHKQTMVRSCVVEAQLIKAEETDEIDVTKVVDDENMEMWDVDCRECVVEAGDCVRKIAAIVDKADRARLEADDASKSLLRKWTTEVKELVRQSRAAFERVLKNGRRLRALREKLRPPPAAAAAASQ